MEQANPIAQLQQAAGQLHRSICGAFAANKQPRVLKQRLLSNRAAPKRINFTPPFAAIIPGDTVVEQVFTTGLSNFLGLYNTALVVRLVLTWFPEPPAFIVGPLSTLCDPYLNLFRGIIPPLGGTLDFSPILAFVLLSVFTNTAAALPCEMGPQEIPPGSRAAQQRQGGHAFDWLPMSKYQAAWAQRVGRSKQRQQGQAGGASA